MSNVQELKAVARKPPLLSEESKARVREFVESALERGEHVFVAYVQNNDPGGDDWTGAYLEQRAEAPTLNYAVMAQHVYSAGHNMVMGRGLDGHEHEA